MAGNIETLNQLSQKIDQLESSYNKTIEKIEETYQTAKKKTEQYSDQFSEIIGSIAEKGLAASFEKNAYIEMRAANIFRLLAVLLMCASAYIILYYLWINPQNEISIISIAKKTVVVFAISIPATYLARESGKHRLVANEYLKKRVYLATIEPYTRNLDPALAEKLFMMCLAMFLAHQKSMCQKQK